MWVGPRAHVALAQVLRLLPEDTRARAACVCTTWRDAAAEPALFATLWFGEGSAVRLNDALLKRVCVRVGRALRELRLEACACGKVTAAGVVEALLFGCCYGLRRLTAAAMRAGLRCARRSRAVTLRCRTTGRRLPARLRCARGATPGRYNEAAVPRC